MKNNKLLKFEIFLIILILVWVTMMKLSIIPIAVKILMMIHACFIGKFGHKVITNILGMMIGICIIVDILMKSNMMSINLNFYMLVDGFIGLLYLVIYSFYTYHKIMKDKEVD